LKPCSIINITNQIKKGYYSPLTMKGTLLVNQLLVSSFAHINNHHLAQLFMFPLRCYYQFNKYFYLNDPFYLYQSEDFNWFIHFSFHFVRYFKPNFLFL
jgi:hypothetical protein